MPPLAVLLAFASLAIITQRADAAVDASQWHGRSIYFVVTDRFARRGGDDDAPCSGMEWCGGTLQGVTDKLDYIQGMGFDALWITPVVKQVDWRDTYNGTGYHGYWAQDFFSIDPHLGTEGDLEELSAECKKRGMLLMLDVVANHVGPMHTVDDIKRLGAPLNRPDASQFHNLGRQPGEGVNDFLKHPDSAFVSEGCFPWFGSACNMTVIRDGWFGDLADLRQEDAVVSNYLLTWISYMVTRYRLDGIRLDTALYMPKWFLKHFQESAGVYMIGEVTTYNMSFHSGFQEPLAGLLNFPVTMMLRSIFNKSGSLTILQELLQQQKHENYKDLDALGNFVDNHDGPRFVHTMGGDVSKLKNGLVWTMLYQGIPIIYYGTEQLEVSNQQDDRTSMWPHYSNSSDLYLFIGKLNGLRKSFGLAAGGALKREEATAVWSSSQSLAFVRGKLMGVITKVGAEGGGDATDATPVCVPLSSLGQHWPSSCAIAQLKSELGGGVHCKDESVCASLANGEPAVISSGNSRTFIV